MRSTKFFSKIGVSISILAVMLLAGCGGDTTNTEYVTTPASTYLVEYIPGMMPASEGKTEFKLRVMKRSDGSMAKGLNISLIPTMFMNNGKSHSTPMDSIVDNSDGTYSCTLYYLMASETMMMGMPTSMGHWELQVKIGTETATLYPYVKMAMSNNTAKGSLKGQADIISTMTGTEKRGYYLFKDDVVTGVTSTFSLFIAAKESMTSFPAISSGTVLTSPTGTWAVDPATTTLLASTDLSTWVTGTDFGSGHWSIGGISGLSSGVTGTVYVQLTVNGELKTIDGLASNGSGTNTYATFAVTP